MYCSNYKWLRLTSYCYDSSWWCLLLLVHGDVVTPMGPYIGLVEPDEVAANAAELRIELRTVDYGLRTMHW